MATPCINEHDERIFFSIPNLQRQFVKIKDFVMSVSLSIHLSCFAFDNNYSLCHRLVDTHAFARHHTYRVFTFSRHVHIRDRYLFSESHHAPVFQLVANFILLLCANLFGMYHKYLTDLTHRRTFLDVRNYIQSMMKLEKEKKQQVDRMVYW